MSKLSTIAAITAASFVFSAAASAQTAPIDYDFNWAPLADGVAVGLPDTFLFSLAGQAMPAHQAGLGDALRRCYSVDVTQGGRNESGSYETTWFAVAQSYGPQNAFQGVDIGLVSIQSATDSDLGGDTCLSPWFSSLGNTGDHKVSVLTNIGTVAGTAGAAFPFYTEVVFEWSSTSSSYTGVAGENVIGTDANGLPLLANVIFEVQGPTNAAAGSHQYYIGTTDELTGQGAASAVQGRGTGGVTNGNSNWGLSLFGTTADQSGVTSHTRIFGFDPGTGTFTAFPSFWGNSLGSSEIGGFVAFSTPFLWAENNGSTGAGAPDWNIASGTPSNVNVWLKDIKSGAEGTNDVLWKAGGGGPAGAAFDPSLIFNFGYFFWSATPAVSMQQLPMSWDDLNGAFTPKAGSYALAVNTLREGVESLPISVDPLTIAILGQAGLSTGTQFTGADSVWYDAGPANQQAIWEGMFDPVESGLSKLTLAGGAAFPVAPAADPTLGGVNIGVAGLSVQIRATSAGISTNTAEVASALTLTLQ